MACDPEILRRVDEHGVTAVQLLTPTVAVVAHDDVGRVVGGEAIPIAGCERITPPAQRELGHRVVARRGRRNGLVHGLRPRLSGKL